MSLTNWYCVLLLSNCIRNKWRKITFDVKSYFCYWKVAATIDLKRMSFHSFYDHAFRIPWC